MQRPIALIITLLFCSSLFQMVSAAGGEDVEPDISNSPIVAINHTVEAADNSDWSINIELDSNAANNNTTIRILSQMCTNDGVCDAPQWVDVEVSENRTNWSSSWKTIDDHSYVNWKVALDYDDGESEEFPSSGYAKAWSSCWYDIDIDKWGGKDCPDGPIDGDGNTEPDSSDSELPFLGFVSISVMLGVAALIRSRSQ